MKKKIIGIFVCVLMIASAIVSATTVKEENIEKTSSDVDVPIWEKGDSWTYYESYNTYGYRDDGSLAIEWHLNCTSTVTVDDDTGDTYKLKLKGKNIQGSFRAGPYRIKYTPLTKFTQVLEHRKTDLAYVGFTHKEKGLVLWLIGKIGIPIPAYYSDVEEASYTTADENFPFPLFEGKNGTFSSFMSTGSVKASLYFGLIKLVWGNWSDFEFPARNYTCGMTNINVTAGEYNAYNISTDMGSAQNYSYMYYVPEVGSYAKFSSHTELDSGKPVSNFEHELVSTTYTP